MQNAKLSGCFDGEKPAAAAFFRHAFVRSGQLQVMQILNHVRKIGEKIYKYVYKKSIV